MRLLPLLLVLAGSIHAAGFETGAVVPTDEGEFFRNTIPQVARLADNRLMAVWSTSAKGVNFSKVYNAFSQDGGKTWGKPNVLMAESGKSMADPNILVDGKRVLVFSTKVSVPNRIDKSWTMVVRSEDNGATWSAIDEIFIPRQYVSGKQHNGIVLRDGSYLVGVAWDRWPEQGMAARSEGEMDLTTGVLISKDGGKKWSLHGALHAVTERTTPGGTTGLCEPSMVELDNGEVLMILRSGAAHHYESRSTDGGVTWSTPVPSPLSGHNTPTALLRLSQNPKEIVAVWNNSPLARYPLSTALSSDGGKTWSTPRILVRTDGLQVSYPGLTQAVDGTIVAVWQQAAPNGGRDIRWARYSRDWILTGK